jgi:hypothetical protein
MNDVMESFKLWCVLSNVHGVIDGTHMLIFKPQTFLPKSYYFHKTWCYSIVVQHVVDCNKTFLGLYVGLPSNVNDVKVLCKFSLYRHVQFHDLFHPKKGVFGFPSYLLSDKVYPQLDNDTLQRGNVVHMILNYFIIRNIKEGGRSLKMSLTSWKRVLNSYKNLNYMWHSSLMCVHVVCCIIYSSVKMKLA